MADAGGAGGAEEIVEEPGPDRDDIDQRLGIGQQCCALLAGYRDIALVAGCADLTVEHAREGLDAHGAYQGLGVGVIDQPGRFAARQGACEGDQRGCRSDAGGQIPAVVIGAGHGGILRVWVGLVMPALLSLFNQPVPPRRRRPADSRPACHNC